MQDSTIIAYVQNDPQVFCRDYGLAIELVANKDLWNSRRYFERLLGIVKLETMAEFRKTRMIDPKDLRIRRGIHQSILNS
jgi:hypothetical protein